MLTVKRVEREKRPGRYRDDRNLFLVVVNPNNRSWDFRYMIDGRERHMGLGPVHTVDLAEARRRARAARLLLLDGIDPIDARKAERAKLVAAKARAITFAEAAQRYHSQHADGWRNAKHRAQFIGTLQQNVFPLIGAVSVAEVDRPLVIRVLEQPVKAEGRYPAGPFWQARPETAARVRGRIEMVLDWATGRGFRAGENPAAWGPLKGVLPARTAVAKVEHHAALPYVGMPSFMAELRKREGVAARALEFGIHTAARTGEIVGAQWPEIEFAAKLWTIPSDRMKARKEHKVPLSDHVVALLRALSTEPGNGFVFLGPRSGSGLSSTALMQVLKSMNRDDITVHGFRSTFRDWASETTNFPNHVVEMQLAHVIGDKVEAAYRRGDLLRKRQQLAEAWSKYCTSPPPAGAVLPMRRPAS